MNADRASAVLRPRMAKRHAPTNHVKRRVDASMPRSGWQRMLLAAYWALDASDPSEDQPAMTFTPPPRLDMPCFTLRAWSAEDAPRLRTTLEVSDAHLRRWTPW